MNRLQRHIPFRERERERSIHTRRIEMKLHFIAAVVFVSALFVQRSSSTTTLVSVTVMYPEANFLPSDAQSTTFGLRGSYPLNWTASLLLHYVSKNTWSTSFPIAADILNATFPTFAVDTKIILNESIWQVGCNDRTVFTFVSTGSHSVTAPLNLFPYFFTFGGETSIVSDVYSPQLNNTRDVWLYIPPGTRENEFRVETNVLIMHDGQNLESLWNVNTHLDQLIAAGLMTSVFVVGPYNTPDRIAEYTYSVDPKYGGGKGNAYLDFLQDTLMPLIQDLHNIETQFANMGIMGSSLGGLISCYAAVTRPQVYSAAGCMSSSFWWNSGDFLTTVVPQLNATASGSQKFYVDSGDSGDTDDDVVDTTAVASALVKRGELDLGRNFFWYLDRGGQHNEAYWSARFHFPMQWLYFRAALNNANGLNA